MNKRNRTEEYKVPTRKQPIFSFVKKILGLFYRKPKVISLTGEMDPRAIIVSNHCSKRGPVILELYLPTFYAPWGAHQMLGNYSERFHYLRDVYYIKKKGSGPFKATLLASFEAFFSIFFYRGMKFLPTYPDVRLLKTVRNSMKVLDSGSSVLVFPENSEEGYKEVLTEFFSGFVVLAMQYYREKGIDVPIYPVYYHDKENVIIIGEPHYIAPMMNMGMNREEIAEKLRVAVNSLFFDHINRGKTENLSAV